MHVSKHHVNGRFYEGAGGSPGSFDLRSSWYLIDPAQGACRAYLAREDGTGGISSKGPIFYNDFFAGACDEGGRSQPGSVYDFLSSVMNEAGQGLYYTLSYVTVHEYVKRYLDLYLPTASWPMMSLIEDHVANFPARMLSQQKNILIGEPYFNDLFYSTGGLAATALFEPRDLANLSNSLNRISHKLEFTKFFVNMFDGKKGHRFQFAADPASISFVKEDTLSSTWQCTQQQCEDAFLPYILFLSTWTLVLATLLCVGAFGQCAIRFTPYTGLASIMG